MRQGDGLRNQLKAIRMRLGLSQQELATTAGVARQTIGGIEAELFAPSAVVALRLARALGCRVEELFWLAGESETLEVLAAAGAPEGAPLRHVLARVGGRWVAHPLEGRSAFRSEMIPADGVGTLAPGASALTVSLLDDLEALERSVVVCGCAPALSLWARSAERWFPGLRVHWMHANSTLGLERLARGEVHAAGVHLSDPETGADNAAFVRALLPGRATALVHLGVWTEGLLVRPGNPKRLGCAADLAQGCVTLVNREAGAGSRMLLDSVLRAAGVSPSAIRGYERTVGSHQEVAQAVAAGDADVGPGAEALAATYGLGFVALREVRYDLAVVDESLQEAPVRQLLSTLEHRWVRSQLAALGGYDTTRTGEVTRVAPSAGDRPA